MKLRRIVLSKSLAIILTTCFHLIIASSALALEIPALQGRVNDLGSLISPSTATQIEQSLKYLEETDSTQIVVLTIPSLEGESLEEFSLKVAETWKIGQSGLDNGALLLVSVKDRKVRIEVGYGLEGTLTDLVAGRIIKNIILPNFKEGRFDQGIIDGVSAMSQAVKGEFSAEDSSRVKNNDDPAGVFGVLIFFFFFVGNFFRKNKIACAIAGGIGAPIVGTLIVGYSLPLLLALIFIGIIGGLIVSKLHVLGGRSHRTSSWGSAGGFSSGSSGGFSGGGGGFGGGGASGGW